MHTESFKVKLGRKIRQLRELKRWSQETLAEYLDYDGGSSTISQIENGLKGMKREKILEAAQLFGIDPHILYSPRDYEDDELQMHLDVETLIQNRKNSPHYEAIKSHLRLAAEETKNKL